MTVANHSSGSEIRANLSAGFFDARSGTFHHHSVSRLSVALIRVDSRPFAGK
jgi:hypothetical protein